MTGRRTRPYVIDLGSANGTFVNNKKIESQRYVFLFPVCTLICTEHEGSFSGGGTISIHIMLYRVGERNRWFLYEKF